MEESPLDFSQALSPLTSAWIGIQGQITDPLLTRSARRFVDAFAMTEFDNPDAALAFKTVFSTEDLEDAELEIAELTLIVNNARRQWSGEGFVRSFASSNSDDFQRMSKVYPNLFSNLDEWEGENVGPDSRERIRDLQKKIPALDFVEKDLNVIVRDRLQKRRGGGGRGPGPRLMGGMINLSDFLRQSGGGSSAGPSNIETKPTSSALPSPAKDAPDTNVDKGNNSPSGIDTDAILAEALKSLEG